MPSGGPGSFPTGFLDRHSARQHREPVVVALVYLLDAESRVFTEFGDGVGPDTCPWECRGPPRIGPDPRGVDQHAGPGLGEVAHDPAAPVQQLRGSPQQRERVAADANVAICQEHGVPASLPRYRVEHVASQGRDAVPTRLLDRLLDDVDPKDGMAL